MRLCSNQQCRMPLAEGEIFCQYCGQEQPMPVPDESSNAVSNGGATETGLPAGKGLPQEKNALGAADIHVPTRGLEAETDTQEKDSIDAGSGECRDLRIRLDSSRLFMEGVNTPMRVYLECLGPDLQNLQVIVRCNVLSAAEKELFSRSFPHFKAGQHREYIINWRPPEGTYGLLALDWSIVYLHGGKRHYYEAQNEFPVYCQQQSAQTVVNEVKVNFERIEMHGNASEFEIKDAVNFYKDLGDRAELTVNELVARSLRAPAVWQGLTLYEDHIDQELSQLSLPPPSDVLVHRLTLSMEGILVHLVGGDRLLLGRNRRETDICTRNFDAQGIATRELNSCLSKQHCRVEVSGERCLVKDGIEGHSSSCGTYTGAGRVDNNGSAIKGNDSLILGCPQSQGKSCLRMTIACFSCQSLGCEECPLPRKCPQVLNAISSVVLSRTDSIKEHYVLLSHYLPLNRLNAGFGAMRIGFVQGAFCYQTARDCGWLRAGMQFKVHGQEVKVESFRQFGMESPE